MKNLSSVHTWAFVGISLLVAGCDDHPRNLITGVTVPPAALKVEIVGPATIAPGQSAQFTAVLNEVKPVGGGSVDAQIEWKSSNASILQVDRSSGIGTSAQQAGETVVAVQVTTSNGGKGSATKEVLVLPDGTYRLVGTVLDSETSPSPIAGATVEVSPGPIVTTADGDGRYRLYGVPADVGVLVRANGYEDFQTPLHLDRNAQLTVQLTTFVPRDILRGNYTLALDVTDACKPGGTIPALAPELRHRQYDAVLTRSAADVLVTLTGPGFSASPGFGDHFTGTIAGGHATFTMDDAYDWGVYPDVVEKFLNNTYLIAEGRVDTKLSGTTWSGQMSGAPTTGANGLWLVDSKFLQEGVTVLGACFGSLRFTLTPR